MAKGGPNRSDEINDSFEEILHDIAEIYDFVNNTIIPAFNGLGATGTYNDIDPIGDGLDGKVILTNNDFSDENNVHFYNSAQGRPKSINETSVKLSQDVNSLFSRINEINARLGAIDQDENTNPATLSEIENSLNHFIGIVRTVQTNTDGYLTASGIATAINDGTINPASFNIGRDDITLNAGIRPTDVSGIDLTAAYDYSAGIPATYDLTDSVQRVKEFVEDVSGDSLSDFGNSGLTGDSLKTHRDSVGTGTVSATNVHGNDIGDFDDANSVTTRLTEIAHFSIRTSGLADDDNDQINYAGGYAAVPTSYTVTRIGLTSANGNNTGLSTEVWVRRGGSNSIVHSGLLITATTPTQNNTTSFDGGTYGTPTVDLVAGDMVYVTNLNGDALDCRLFVWGTPT